MADATPSSSSDLSRVSDLKDAASLAAKVKQIRQGRSIQEREWKLNVAFYRGNQWVWFNKFSGRVESLPSNDAGELPRWRVRLTSNQVLPGVQAYIAMLTKTKPVISATPDTGSDTDIKAAQVAELLFEHWWRDFDLKAKLQEALLWSVLGSAGYWLITYDPQAGKGVTFLKDPQGKPVLNPELETVFREQLQREAEAMGLPVNTFVQAQEQTVFMGDINVRVLGPHQVFLDPTASSFEDADWAICEFPMSPDEIQGRFGVKLEPDAIPTDFESGLPLNPAVQQTANKTVKKVYIGYFKPTPFLPKGRYVVFTEGPDKILYDGPWQFPFEDLPLVKFSGPRVPGSTTDEALVTHARPYQKLINAILSKVVEHVYLTIRPQMIAPENSLRQRLTNEPGAVFTFSPVATAGGVIEPKWRDMPTIPPYVFSFLEEVQARIDRLFNLQAVTKGDVPPNVEAGVAIDLLQEAAVDQVAPVIQGMENSLAKAGNLMVALAKKFYVEPRLLKVTGPGGAFKVQKFQQADLSGGFSFHAEAGSGLPRTRAGRQARIESLIGMQVIRPDQAWKYLDIADLKGLAAVFASDEEHAQREQEKLLRGIPLNVPSMQQAMMALQQGVNPETGQPLGPGDDPQELLHRASLAPTPFENWQTHLDTHALWMKSVEFEGLPPEVQQDALTHFELTRQMLFSIPALPEPQAVRTNVQLKGTLDPDTAAKVLMHSGVPEANPDELRQPPLDTWVSDALDKPNANASGNDPMTAAQALQGMAQAEDQHQAKMAKAQHDAALAALRVKQAQRQLAKKPTKAA